MVTDRAAGAGDVLRAVVADDSPFMRTIITDILEGGDIEVAAEAGDGQEAVAAVEAHDPDVVTMDVEMPEMNGVEAVSEIMDTHPTPIMMLSAHTDEDADVTFEALENGAVDFFTKPGGEVSVEMAGFEDQLVETVETVASADVTDSPRAPETAQSGSTPSDAQYVEEATVVVGSSTGGPSVVEGLLADLPIEAGARVVVVQHMPNEFTGRFAERLDRQSDYDVREATDGDRLAGGEVAVAPGGSHLVVRRDHAGTLSLALDDGEPVHGVKPAIDVTMASVAETVDARLIGVVLTGMGKDGAAGSRDIADAGGYVIAQDESTSAVFGMPQQAIETGAVDAVLPEGEIATGVTEHLRTDP